MKRVTEIVTAGGSFMCGRFTLRTPPHEWCQLWFPGIDLEGVAEDPPRYNIAPTQSVVAVVRKGSGGQLAAVSLRWGLVPPWADDVSIGNRMINARAETIDTKRSFQKPFAERRCLVAADGYYEWKQIGDRKQPYLIERRDGAPFAFAALWEENSRAATADAPLRSCTIITTEASGVARQVHDRMPVIVALDRNHERVESWLDPAFRDRQPLKAWLQQGDADELRLVPVSTHVNNPRHEDADCVQPVDEGAS